MSHCKLGRGPTMCPKDPLCGVQVGLSVGSYQTPTWVFSSPENDADTGNGGASDEQLKIRRKTYRGGCFWEKVGSGPIARCWWPLKGEVFGEQGSLGTGSASQQWGKLPTETGLFLLRVAGADSAEPCTWGERTGKPDEEINVLPIRSDKRRGDT